MSIAAVKNDRLCTCADYLQSPEDDRWEIIDGVAYNMSPAPTPEHQNSVGELNVQVRPQLRGKPWREFMSPIDVRFEHGDQTREVVRPDLLVVCDRSKITPKGIVGAPDWIVEILSRHTAGKDHIIKRALYQKHGVREYWLVHPVDRIVTVYRLRPDGSYGANEMLEAKGRLAVTALPGIEVDWDLWESLDADESDEGSG